MTTNRITLRQLIGTSLLLASTACHDSRYVSGHAGGEYGESTADSDDYAPMTEDELGEEEPICNADDPVTFYLSPDDSNSMSSPELLKAAVLDEWGSLYNVPIRTFEFMNYYSFDYARPLRDGLRLSAAMVADEDEQDGYVLQIGVASPGLSAEARAPMNITLVLDTSGSMSGTPIRLLKRVSRGIAGQLKAGDKVSMVTWDTSNAVVLDSLSVDGPDDPRLIEKIQQMEAGGGTDLHGGLVAGYRLAEKNFSTDRINRILLVSDGGANAGITDIDIIADAAGGQDEDGVYMVGVGVGDPGSYNDALMDQVTDAGKGASVFIANDDEIGKIFGTDFVNTMAVAARNVRVSVDLPPGFEIVEFSGEEYSTDPAEVEPQHIAPNDAMVFLQSIRTCAPEELDQDSEITFNLQFRDPTTHEEQDRSQTYTINQLLDADRALLRKGQAVFEFAEGVKVFKRTGSHDDLVDAFEALEVAEDINADDPDLAEIRMILETL